MAIKGSVIVGCGGVQTSITREEARVMLEEALAAWGDAPRKVLVLPPDATRLHSGAGELTVLLYEMIGGRCQFDIMPALGTHAPMRPNELEMMFPGIPHERFLVHNWRADTVRLGEVPAEYVEDLSEGRLSCAIDVEVNRRLAQGGYDLVLSIGQVVPHEVIGMANQNKNLLVGIGGADFVNKTHFLGAVHGMERIMGRIDTPVRRVLDYAESGFLAELPIKYILTVKGGDEAGRLHLRGLYLGEGKAPYFEAARLSQRVNLDLLAAPIKKALVNLDPREYKSTWLGNKAIYRTRMAMADAGELIVYAPGVKAFGEDAGHDELIRRHGYHGTPHTLGLVEREETLRRNLSVAAHLIHGSSEGRFKVTYAAGGLTREEVEGAGFIHATPDRIRRQYQPEKLKRGLNDVGGEEVFYIENPSLGLWALARDFD